MSVQADSLKYPFSLETNKSVVSSYFQVGSSTWLLLFLDLSEGIAKEDRKKWKNSIDFLHTNVQNLYIKETSKIQSMKELVDFLEGALLFSFVRHPFERWAKSSRNSTLKGPFSVCCFISD